MNGSTMDVACERCGTEYEFDDTLISAMGTSVKCTGCGYQFKVFPPTDSTRPEVWTQYPAAGGAPVIYDSLRGLQHAIAEAHVGHDDRIARGDEQPRRVADIAELEPLLRHPESIVPPPGPGGALRGQDPLNQIPDLRRAPTGTVMGLSAPKTPNIQGPAPPQSIPPSSGTDGPRPKIQSALSVAPPPSSEAERSLSSSPPPRQSLRASLSGPRDPSTELPPSSPRRWRGDSASDEEPPRTSAPPPLPPEALSQQTERQLRDSVGQSSPEIRASSPSSADMTPTPSSLRYSSDSMPSSAFGTGVQSRRGARSIWLVLAVAAGAGAFVFTVGRDRIVGSFSGELPSATTSLEVADSAALLQDARDSVALADVSWLRLKLASKAQEPAARAALGEQVASAERKMQNLKEARGSAERSAEEAWLLIHLLRIKGSLRAARKNLAGLSGEDARQAYGLAMLDLAEQPEQRPYPLILSRLKQAGAGEREKFVARSGYIFALAESGESEHARSDFQAFTSLKGATEAPLYQDLEAYLARVAPEKSFEDSGLALPVAEQPALQPEIAVKPPEPPPKPSTAAPAASDPVAPAQAPKKAVAAPKTSKTPEVTAELQATVSQADALWGQGDREGAVRLYRQVVASIGTSHFLGQRSAARIAQAEREMSE